MTYSLVQIWTILVFQICLYKEHWMICHGKCNLNVANLALAK